MPVLVEVGVVELRLGVLSGWLMLIRRRACQPQRLRQGHIDLLMMGTILVALGAAIPSPSR